MRLILPFTFLFITGCTLHVCGNSETSHLVGGGTIGEQQQNEDTAEVEANIKTPDAKPMGL